jgi:hypothetical protein
MEATSRVAIMYNINIAEIDRPRIKVSLNNNLRVAKALIPMIEILSNHEQVTAIAKVFAPHVLGEYAIRGEKRRRARSQRIASRDDDSLSLPSNKHRRLFKEAASHLEYQDLMKEKATSTASLYLSNQYFGESSTSMARAVKEMQESLTSAGMEVCDTSCYTHVKKTIANNGVGLSPQKPGGVALPSHIEKRVANVVRTLRARKLPVFQSEVLKWAEEEIKGTEYGKYFVNGNPTIGWYIDWLKRMDFTTGVLRSLEQTRSELFTAENLAIYFDVARDVLLYDGVSTRNPDYDLEIPYSEEILIKHPERICSYDETKI